MLAPLAIVALLTILALGWHRHAQHGRAESAQKRSFFDASTSSSSSTSSTSHSFASSTSTAYPAVVDDRHAQDGQAARVSGSADRNSGHSAHIELILHKALSSADDDNKNTAETAADDDDVMADADGDAEVKLAKMQGRMHVDVRRLPRMVAPNDTIEAQVALLAQLPPPQLRRRFFVRHDVVEDGLFPRLIGIGVQKGGTEALHRRFPFLPEGNFCFCTESSLPSRSTLIPDPSHSLPRRCGPL